jgi:tRNA(Ile)-lysidine synthase
VSFDQGSLLRKLAELAELSGKPDRLVVAFSGGLDSTVLLHALASSRDAHQTALLAIHIDHGLHPESAAWCRHCRSFATSLDIEFESVKVAVRSDSGQGLEAAAREARYAAFRAILRSGDCLLSAHHKDDQAETLLLNLMRGSGPAGLAGIGEVRSFAAGWLLRPLLSVSREELQDYATQHALRWIDDPSNEDRTIDRNYLRHEVLPLLEERWPGAASRLQRRAVLASEAATMLDQLADSDFHDLGGRPDRLTLDTLRRLPAERQRNVLRYVIRELGLPSPPAAQLHSVVADLIPARDDGQPIVQWPGAEIRRYREQLYVLATSGPESANPVAAKTDGRFTLAAGMGELKLESGAPSGLAEDLVARGLELRYRAGGEEIKPVGQAHTRKLKKLLQEEGVVPWMRERLPLLYAGGELVAVADLWLASSAASAPGVAVRWINRPPIH